MAVERKNHDSEFESGSVEMESNMTDVINISASNQRFEVDGSRYLLKPGQVVPIHNAYALPRQMTRNKDAVASAVELLTNKCVLPVTDPRARAMVSAARK